MISISEKFIKLLNGRRMSLSEIASLKEKGIIFPECLVRVLCDYKVTDACFSVSEEDDISGIGLDMEWMSAKDIIIECFDFQPGLSVSDLGFFPVGSCLQGSGDPYFIDLRNDPMDPPLVRIPHDFAVMKPYPVERIELVCRSISDFFSLASIT